MSWLDFVERHPWWTLVYLCVLSDMVSSTFGKFVRAVKVAVRE